MTLDHVGGGAPVVEEAGVLFAFGRTGPPIGVEFAKGWKYQAPCPPVQLAQQKYFEKQASTERFWPSTWSDGSPWDLDQEQREPSIEDDTRLNEFLYVPEQPVGDKRARLDQFLNSLPITGALTDAHLEPILQLLETTLEDPGGAELESVFRALAPHSVNGDNWKRLAKVIQAKIWFQTLGFDELVSALKLVLNRTNDWKDVSAILSIGISKTALRDSLLEILEYIVRSPEHRSKTKTWLSHLRMNHPAIRDGFEKYHSWQKLYRFLAEHFQPSDANVVHHFGSLRRTDFARILLKFYLPAWFSEATTQFHVTDNSTRARSYTPFETAARDQHSTSTLSVTEVTDKNAMAIHQSTALDYTGCKVVYRAFEDFSREVEKAVLDNQTSALPLKSRLGKVRLQLFELRQSSFCARDRGAQNHIIFRLATLLERWRLPYAQFLEEVFAVYTQTQADSVTKNLFMALRVQGKCGIPTKLAGKLVHHFLASGKFDYAYYVFHNVPTLPLLPYAELLLKLIEGGRTHGDKIFEMLNRYHPEDRIRWEWRKHPRLGIKPEQITLVHEMAYTFASSEHLSPRTALRRVWECFRYLRDRRAPLQPLISRALVKAGISRPLEERERLSEQQVKYIISIVDHIEGPEIAREVDQIVWDAWNWSSERRLSLSLPRPAKGPDDQGELYAKQRRLWGQRGGRVYLPFFEALESTNDQEMTVNEDTDHLSNLHGDSRGSAGETDPLGKHTDSPQDIKPASALAEMNKVTAAIPNPGTPPDLRASKDLATVDSVDSELFVPELNEVLSSCVKDLSGTESDTSGNTDSGHGSTAETTEATHPLNMHVSTNIVSFTKSPSVITYRWTRDPPPTRPVVRIPTMHLRLRKKPFHPKQVD